MRVRVRGELCCVGCVCAHGLFVAPFDEPYAHIKGQSLCALKEDSAVVVAVNY